MLDVKRGAIVAYRKEPWKKLVCVSDPYDFNGQQVVTYRTCEKSKNARGYGMCVVEALVPYSEQKGGVGNGLQVHR